jgi:hypothetical protein
MLEAQFSHRARYRMSQTLIQEAVTHLVGDFINRAKALKSLQHELTKGTLKELFVAGVLQRFLPVQLGIGSGIIINDKNQQSRQTDIVIYDKRVMPPFIMVPGIGVYPVESVVATIEIKTKLGRTQLMQAERAAQILKDVFACRYSGYDPLCAVFGFEGGVRGLDEQATGQELLKNSVHHLRLICIAGRYSWAPTPRWKIGRDTSGVHDEAKRFLALFLDNIRTHAELRLSYLMMKKHQDWFSAYIRG